MIRAQQEMRLQLFLVSLLSVRFVLNDLKCCHITTPNQPAVRTMVKVWKQVKYSLSNSDCNPLIERTQQHVFVFDCNPLITLHHIASLNVNRVTHTRRNQRPNAPLPSLLCAIAMLARSQVRHTAPFGIAVVVCPRLRLVFLVSIHMCSAIFSRRWATI